MSKTIRAFIGVFKGTHKIVSKEIQLSAINAYNYNPPDIKKWPVSSKDCLQRALDAQGI